MTISGISTASRDEAVPRDWHTKRGVWIYAGITIPGPDPVQANLPRRAKQQGSQRLQGIAFLISGPSRASRIDLPQRISGPSWYAECGPSAGGSEESPCRLRLAAKGATAASLVGASQTDFSVLITYVLERCFRTVFLDEGWEATPRNFDLVACVRRLRNEKGLVVVGLGAAGVQENEGAKLAMEAPER